MFFLLGSVVGAFGTLVGVGGGLILIPVFLWGFGYSAAQTIGTSLFIVLFNAISGTWAYIKQKKVFYHAAIRFGLATIPGAFLGSYVAHYFTGATFSLAFGLFLVFMSGMMYFKSSKQEKQQPFNQKEFRYNSTLGIISSVGVGFISSVLGIGGGIIHVPMMIYALGFPTHVATATSTCVLALSSFVGVISHFILGHVLWLPGICVGIGAIVGAQIGAKIATKSKPRAIIILLSIVVFFLGVRFIMSGMSV